MATEALVGIGYINIINANALAGIEKHAWAKASNIHFTNERRNPGGLCPNGPQGLLEASS